MRASRPLSILLSPERAPKRWSVLLAVEAFADGATVRAVVKYTGFSRDSVRSHMIDLEALTVVKRHAREHNPAGVYRVTERGVQAIISGSATAAKRQPKTLGLALYNAAYAAYSSPEFGPFAVETRRWMAAQSNTPVDTLRGWQTKGRSPDAAKTLDFAVRMRLHVSCTITGGWRVRPVTVKPKTAKPA